MVRDTIIGVSPCSTGITESAHDPNITIIEMYFTRYLYLPTRLCGIAAAACTRTFSENVKGKMPLTPVAGDEWRRRWTARETLTRAQRTDREKRGFWKRAGSDRTARNDTGNNCAIDHARARDGRSSNAWLKLCSRPIFVLAVVRRTTRPRNLFSRQVRLLRSRFDVMHCASVRARTRHGKLREMNTKQRYRALFDRHWNKTGKGRGNTLKNANNFHWINHRAV